MKQLQYEIHSFPKREPFRISLNAIFRYAAWTPTIKTVWLSHVCFHIFKLNLAGNLNTTNSLSIITMQKWMDAKKTKEKTMNFAHQIVLFCNGIHWIRHGFCCWCCCLNIYFLWVIISEACRFWRDVDVWKIGFLHLIVIAQCKHEHKHKRRGMYTTANSE